MESIWRIGGCGMTDNRLRQITYSVLGITTIVFWYGVFTIGLIKSLFYLLSICFTIAILINYRYPEQSHHDSRKGSFYEISNRKDK